jgi:cytidyltransferase-like protein
MKIYELKKLKVNNIKVLCAGTFDIFHKGHEYFINECKSYGDVLYVIIARDKSVKKIKNINPKENESIRLEKVKNNKNVDFAYLGDLNDFYKIPKNINPDIICLGYDQIPPKDFLLHFANKKIVKIKPFFPEKYKSSILREI